MQHSINRWRVSPLWLLLMGGGLCLAWADNVFHVDVGVVVVSFTVKDAHGKYVSHLKPEQICVREDNVEQRVQSFAEAADDAAVAAHSAAIPSSVFILFDTSNCMYEGFARAEDEIATFIRSLDPSHSVAVYSFSHNMTRLTRLTSDHEQAIRALRSAAAGDSTAALNSILLTLRDAATVPGRKVVLVFSNGPDDTSVVGPEDVGRVAEDEGIPIYIVATRMRDSVCQSAFSFLSSDSGGQLFLARNPASQLRAFQAISDDLKHTYTLTYFPQSSSNTGWRKIDLQVRGGQQYEVQTRKGYWPSRRPID